jgi:hypothetical protein
VKARRLSLSATLAAAAVAVAAAPTAATAARPQLRVYATAVKTLSAKPVRTTVTVKNVSKRRLTGLTVTVRTPKGVKVTVAGARRGTASRTLKALRAGQTARVGVSLRGSRSAPKRGRFTVQVTRGHRTLASARVAFGGSSKARRGSRPTPGRRGPATPPANPNTLAGRYFWGSNYTLNGIEQLTLYFTSDTLVDTAPTGSAWPACNAPSDSCKPYSYDARTNTLTIDGRAATLSGRTLTLDGQGYAELGFPPAGARWDTTITYANSSGLCPLYCSYFTENLTFRPDGSFARDAIASGTGPVVDWSSIPPSSKGTYEVRRDHTLLMAYEDGRQVVDTVGLYLNDDGSLQAPGRGVILGGDGYFDIGDD